MKWSVFKWSAWVFADKEGDPPGICWELVFFCTPLHPLTRGCASWVCIIPIPPKALTSLSVLFALMVVSAYGLVP